MVGVRRHPEPDADPCACRWSLRAFDSTDRPDGSLGSRRATAEHQLQEVHAASRAVHGRSWLQQSGRVLVPPLREPANHRGPCTTVEYRMVGRTVIEASAISSRAPADLRLFSEFIADFVKFALDAKKAGKTVAIFTS